MRGARVMMGAGMRRARVAARQADTLSPELRMGAPTQVGEPPAALPEPVVSETHITHAPDRPAAPEPERESREKVWERRFRVPVLAAAVLSVPLAAVSIIAPPVGVGAVILKGAHVALWSVFASEAGFLLATTKDRRRWIRKHPLEVGVVIAASPFIPMLASLAGAARIAPAAKALKALKAGKGLKAVKAAKIAKSVKVVKKAGGGSVIRGLLGRAAMVFRR